MMHGYLRQHAVERPRRRQMAVSRSGLRPPFRHHRVLRHRDDSRGPGSPTAPTWTRSNASSPPTRRSKASGACPNTPTPTASSTATKPYDAWRPCRARPTTSASSGTTPTACTIYYEERAAHVADIAQACDAAGNPDRYFKFASTSKVTFAGRCASQPWRPAPPASPELGAGAWAFRPSDAPSFDAASPRPLPTRRGRRGRAHA